MPLQVALESSCVDPLDISFPTELYNTLHGPGLGTARLAAVVELSRIQNWTSDLP